MAESLGGMQGLLDQIGQLMGLSDEDLTRANAKPEGLVSAYDRLVAAGVPREALSQLAAHREPEWITGCWRSTLSRIASVLRANCWHNGKVLHQLPKEFTTYLLVAQPLNPDDVPYSEVMLDCTIGEKGNTLERFPFYRTLTRTRFWETARRTYPRLVMSVKADFYYMPQHSEPGHPAYQITLQVSPYMGGTSFARTLILRFDAESTSMDMPVSSPCVTINSKLQWAAAVRRGADMEQVLPTTAPEGYVNEYVKQCFHTLLEGHQARYDADAIMEHFEDMDEPFITRVMGRNRAAYNSVVQPITEVTGAQWRSLFEGRAKMRQMPIHYPVDGDMLWSDPAVLAAQLKAP